MLTFLVSPFSLPLVTKLQAYMYPVHPSPNDHASSTTSYIPQSDHSGKRLLRILLTYPFPLLREARRSCAGGPATMYNSIMEHTATVIICKKTPNVSGRGVSPQTGIRASVPTKVDPKWW